MRTSIDIHYLERDVQEQKDDVEDDDEGEQGEKIHVNGGGGGGVRKCFFHTFVGDLSTAFGYGATTSERYRRLPYITVASTTDTVRTD